jgi:iron complex outermembrane receptor protein
VNPESSGTERHNCFENFSTGSSPDNKFQPPAYPFTTNCKLLEWSDWEQGQVFADFDWRPVSNLTISPGFKYVVFKRDIDATDESISGGSKNQGLQASNTYSSPLYFLTANYKIKPDWAVYGQFATSFLIPALSALYVNGANIQHLQSEYTTNYQLGTVYSHGDFTADGDIYYIDATNLQIACTVPGTPPESAFCNVGKAYFDGVEGEMAYAFNFGLTLFANASYNQAMQDANAANIPAGIAANPKEELPNAPLWTDAFGAIYTHGPWSGTLTYKQSGAYVVYGQVDNDKFKFSGFDTIDASLAYNFGRVIVKLQGFNLLDRRAITAYVPSSSATQAFADDGSFYTFQTGRDLELTLIGKF